MTQPKTTKKLYCSHFLVWGARRRDGKPIEDYRLPVIIELSRLRDNRMARGMVAGYAPKIVGEVCAFLAQANQVLAKFKPSKRGKILLIETEDYVVYVAPRIEKEAKG